jgi:hypothetical protein
LQLFQQRSSSCNSYFPAALPWVNSCNVFLTLPFEVWDNLSYAEYLIFFPIVQQPIVGQGLLMTEASRSHSDTPHSVGLLWTRISQTRDLWQHTTLTQDRYPCPLAGFEPAIPKPDRPHNHPWDKGDHWNLHWIIVGGFKWLYNKMRFLKFLFWFSYPLLYPFIGLILIVIDN